jgi:hypothetical protein
MQLQLRGLLSCVDKYGKLQFAFRADSSDKLARHCVGTNVPFDKHYFAVHLGLGRTRAGTALPEDISALIGRECVVWVRLANHTFISPAKHNRGSQVVCTKLILEDIRQAD